MSASVGSRQVCWRLRRGAAAAEAVAALLAMPVSAAAPTPAATTAKRTKATKRRAQDQRYGGPLRPAAIADPEPASLNLARLPQMPWPCSKRSRRSPWRRRHGA
jgi:hypothetical protein